MKEFDSTVAQRAAVKASMAAATSYFPPGYWDSFPKQLVAVTQATMQKVTKTCVDPLRIHEISVDAVWDDAKPKAGE